jgi:hypothetical protein
LLAAVIDQKYEPNIENIEEEPEEQPPKEQDLLEPQPEEYPSDADTYTPCPVSSDDSHDSTLRQAISMRMLKKLPTTSKRRAMHEHLSKKLRPGNPFLEVLQNDLLHQQVILNMALQREPCSKESPSQPVSNVIREGFFWRDYPVLEEMLYDNMAEYYQISSVNRQSKFQQTFNNQLVERIRKVALQQGWVFEEAFTVKKLRDRVRCFFKTHLQNAKKRLATLLKHPESVSHQALLQQYWPADMVGGASQKKAL